MVKRGVIVVVVLLVCAGAAQARAPLVPVSTQNQLKDLVAQFGEPQLAYVPTAAPKYFALVNFGASRTSITYTVADSRYPTGNPQERSVFFFIEPFRGSLAKCRQAKNGVAKLGKVKVYYQGYAAWRCVLAPNGKLVRLKAESSIVRGGALGLMVASITRIH
jgi:hypothetical protein